MSRIAGVSEAGDRWRNPERSEGAWAQTCKGQKNDTMDRIESGGYGVTRFRDSWFVQAGIGIAAVSVLPLVVVSLSGLIAGREFGVGPTGILALLGVTLGFLSVVLGVIGVLVRRRDPRS